MRKTALFIVVVFLLFSLSGCVVFQKVMNVSGNWILEIENTQVVSELRSLSEETNSRQPQAFYATLKLIQNGNQLTGKFYIMYFESNLSGTIGEDNSIEIEVSLPQMDVQRNSSERPAETFVISGTVSGNNSLFNKEATKITGKFYPKTNPNSYLEFEASK